MDIWPYNAEECKTKYKQTKRRIMQEAFNLSDNDTNTKLFLVSLEHVQLKFAMKNFLLKVKEPWILEKLPIWMLN